MSGSARQIVGLFLARNEDLHIRRAVENVAAFCDRIMLADHGSTDGTARIFAELAAAYPHVATHQLAHPSESHALIKDYAATDTWIFAVDGDEIYDPAGLAALRTRLFAGEFDDWWMILGNVLNCDFVEPAAHAAAGYLAPPCRSITKLYNFRVIRSWDGATPERLHGGNLVFQPGYDASARLNLHEQTAWEDSPLRCLHTCFVPRSSRDAAQPPIRQNIMDLHSASLATRLHRWWQARRGRPVESDWKKSRYMRGPRVTIDATAFFP